VDCALPPRIGEGSRNVSPYGKMMFVATPTLSTEQILGLLTVAPVRIAEATARLTPALLRTAPVAGEWSANDVLAHLRACADVWGRDMARILTEDEPTIKAVNPRSWIDQTNYPELEFRPSLRRYTAQRRTLLTLLGPLTLEQWSRRATITGAGAPLPKTVLSYGDRMARHERTHVGQIQKISAAL
jgi:hypothetical protein